MSDRHLPMPSPAPGEVMSGRSIRVLCVDDHRLVRDGIALMVDREPDMEVVGCAASAREAVSAFSRLRPDVTLMDLQLGTSSGVDAIRAIHRIDPAGKIIVLTMYDGDEDIFRALEAGAANYLSKDLLIDDLIQTMRAVIAGKHSIRPEVKAKLEARAACKPLTPRELEVIKMLAKRMRNKDIARTLGISEETVQVHVRNIVTKLNARDRTTAVDVALHRGIIHRW